MSRPPECPVCRGDACIYHPGDPRCIAPPAAPPANTSALDPALLNKGTPTGADKGLRAKIEALRELSDAATDGPWLAPTLAIPAMLRVDTEPEFPHASVAWVPDGSVGRDEAQANARLIAAAVNLVRALLDGSGEQT